MLKVIIPTKESLDESGIRLFLRRLEQELPPYKSSVHHVLQIDPLSEKLLLILRLSERYVPVPLNDGDMLHAEDTIKRIVKEVTKK